MTFTKAITIDMVVKYAQRICHFCTAVFLVGDFDSEKEVV